MSGHSASSSGYPGGQTGPHPAALADAAQDWMVVQDKDGKLVARAEDEYTWREEKDGIRVFLLIVPSSRGDNLDVLNKNGLVMVDIKPRLLRITITDVLMRKTWRFQWLNLWEEIDPEKSKYHLSVDNKRVVVWLQKLASPHRKDPFGMRPDARDFPWGDLVDIRKGRYTKLELGWPTVLCEVQGSWRSEDEEPIEIIGHQVVWPEGSRDFMMVDEQDETFKLTQQGDGDRIPEQQFFGIYERHAERLKWDDGDYWTRVPGLAWARKEAGRHVLPLEYDKTLARWVPWLPTDEIRRRVEHWLPPNESEIGVQVYLAEGPELEVKRQLMAGTDEGDSKDGLVLRDFEFLPLDLLLKCRVCALDTTEQGHAGIVPTMLALRDKQRISLANEAAALGGLQCWFQWLRCWLAPGSRRNVDAALEAIRERLYNVAKEDHKLNPDQPRENLGLSYVRWPPDWVCTVTKPNDLLKKANEALLEDIRASRKSLDGARNPRQAFEKARRRVAEKLFDDHQITAGNKRCDPAERNWVKCYGNEASCALFNKARRANLNRELQEGGMAILEDAIDWGTLAKAQGEVTRLLGEDLQDPRVKVYSARGGHARWATVWETRTEDLGMPAISAAISFASQTAVRLNEWQFNNCNWYAEDPVIWCDDGEPLQLGRQKALGWARPASAGEAPLAKPAEDEEGRKVPPERCLLLFLFLNPPAWLPDWGGALRCHVGAVHRDVWGDGGRLVLLRESERFELLPSQHSHSVLMMRLQGSVIEGPRMRGANEAPRNEAEKDQDKLNMKEVAKSKMPPKPKERPASYHRVLTNAEIRALGEQVGVFFGNDDEEESEEDESEEESEEESPSGDEVKRGSAAGSAAAASMTAGSAAAGSSAAGGMAAGSTTASSTTAHSTVEGGGIASGTSDSRGAAPAAESGGGAAEPPNQEEAEAEEPLKLKLNSHQAVQLIELCNTFAFRLD
mmetsp:Transcript_114873/g.198998  ORF Transcript_114873/g.198998 Transcript_114873/m.198998 type:complete len:961 (+) Transcript_114873:73-2955(+)